MTADLDLSPEAVERLADRLNGIYRIPITDGLGPAGGDEPDNPNEFVRRFTTAPIQQEAAATIRALAAENARLRAERDEQRERAEEAESEITRAQEQVSDEFEGDCWKAMRNLLDRTGFDWSDYSEDGVTASDAQRWIVEELDRLEAERDAAWQAGAVAMRAKATDRADEIAVSMFVQQTGGAAQYFANRSDMAEFIARAIRALPIPDKEAAAFRGHAEKLADTEGGA